MSSNSDLQHTKHVLHQICSLSAVIMHVWVNAMLCYFQIILVKWKLAVFMVQTCLLFFTINELTSTHLTFQRASTCFALVNLRQHHINSRQAYLLLLIIKHEPLYKYIHWVYSEVSSGFGAVNVIDTLLLCGLYAWLVQWLLVVFTPNEKQQQQQNINQ